MFAQVIPAAAACRTGRQTLNYTFDFTPVWEGFPNLLWGCLGTLGLSLGGMALAIVIGIGGVVLRDSRFQPLRWLTIAFVETIRNTPFLVQIYFIFFAMISNQIFKPLLVFGDHLFHHLLAAVALWHVAGAPVCRGHTLSGPAMFEKPENTTGGRP
jgi:His/Glu/Gln/Arg/opine family amino acid ABC transporter permease subunit